MLGLLGRLGPPLPCHCGEEVSIQRASHVLLSFSSLVLAFAYVGWTKTLGGAGCLRRLFNLFAFCLRWRGFWLTAFTTALHQSQFGYWWQLSPGSSRRDFWQRASWGIASSDGATFCGTGFRGRADPACRWKNGFITCLFAAKAANKPILILCDNEAVYLRFSRALHRITGLAIYLLFGIWFETCCPGFFDFSGAVAWETGKLATSSWFISSRMPWAQRSGWWSCGVGDWSFQRCFWCDLGETLRGCGMVHPMRSIVRWPTRSVFGTLCWIWGLDLPTLGFMAS